MEENNIRNNWKKAIENTDNICELSSAIHWGFSAQDLIILMFLHENGDISYRTKIEELLEDCNFHTFCGYLSKLDYDSAENEILQEYDYFN